MSAFDDAALLEALLHYAQPGKDTGPLAMALLERFGSLGGVLSTPPTELISVPGVKESTAALITAVNAVHRRMLLDPAPPNIPSIIYRVAEPPPGEGGRHPFVRREGTGLVSKALLREAMEILPEVPPDATVQQIRAFFTDQARPQLRRHPEAIHRVYFGISSPEAKTIPDCVPSPGLMPEPGGWQTPFFTGSAASIRSRSM